MILQLTPTITHFTLLLYLPQPPLPFTTAFHFAHSSVTQSLINFHSAGVSKINCFTYISFHIFQKDIGLGAPSDVVKWNKTAFGTENNCESGYSQKAPTNIDESIASKGDAGV